MNQQDPANPDPTATTRCRRTAIGTLILALAIATVSGCGIGPHPATAAQPAAAPATGTVQPSPPDAPANPPPPATSHTSDADSDRPYCQTLSLNLSVLTTAATSPDDSTIEQAITKLRQLAQTAPEEIRNDIVVIADFDQRIADQVHAGKKPDIEETPELTSALAHEAQWSATHCG